MNKLQKAEKWLLENAPHIKILEWGGKNSSKCKFINLRLNREFYYKFDILKSKVKLYPDREFGMTTSERLERIKKTNLKLYGVEFPFQSKKIQDKQKESMIKNHGVLNPSLSKEIVEKRKKIFLDKFGFDNPKCIGSILIDGKSIPEWAKEKGYAITTFYRKYKFFKDDDAIINHATKENQIYTEIELPISKLLESKNIDFVHNQKIPNTNRNFRPDFRLEKYKLIIECDGERYHDPKYGFTTIEHEANRQQFYESLGYKFLSFWGREILHNFNFVSQTILQHIKQI